ncbi:cofilin [Podila minutissima]|uniref:Cofilin n=1 Tax=Podila minutissima TaxID=64525 RepID=A0A9P5SMH7_9FUNG|nr:cofilin [Podila minutissima]
MSSGVGVNPECLNSFQELKLKKVHKYIIYKLSEDNKSIEVEKTSEASATYDDFVQQLPEDDCRYAVYDFDYTLPDGPRNKIVFFTWSPDNSKIKAKMIYASSKDALRKQLQGIGAEIQGTDFDEVHHDAVLEKVNRK